MRRQGPGGRGVMADRAETTGLPLPFLGFDLSTPATLVAIKPVSAPLSHRLVRGDNRSEQLFPAIRGLLEETGLSPRDLRSIGVGRGPGAFTGIRNAVMAAKTFAWVLGLPLLAPTTLEILALGVKEAVAGDIVVPLIDARRKEVYSAVWAVTPEGLVPLSEPEVAAPPQVSERVMSLAEGFEGNFFLVGTGAEAYREPFSALGTVSPSRLSHPGPHALLEACRRAMEAGEAQDPMGLLPLYVRKPDAIERPTGVK